MKLRNKVKYECDFNYICIVNLINLIFIIKYFKNCVCYYSCSVNEMF